MPSRTVSPWTSRTTTRTSSPITMLSPARRVRTSKLRLPYGRVEAIALREGYPNRPVRPREDDLRGRTSPTVDDHRCQQISVELLVITAGRGTRRENGQHER